MATPHDLPEPQAFTEMEADRKATNTDGSDNPLIAAIRRAISPDPLVWLPSFRYATMSCILQEGSKGTALRLILEPTGRLLAPRMAVPSETGSTRDLRLSLSVLTSNEQSSSSEDGVMGYIQYSAPFEAPELGVRNPVQLEGVAYCAAEHMARLATLLGRYGEATEWVIRTEQLALESSGLPESDYIVEPSQRVAVRDLAALYPFRTEAEPLEAGSPSRSSVIQNLLERIDGHLRGGVRIRIF